MSADPRTDPPTPDPLTAEADDVIADALVAAFDATNPRDLEAIHRNLLAALPSAPDQRLRDAEATTSPEASLDVARLRAAKFVAGHWLDAVMSSDSLRQTGMSHPLAMVLAAIDGETDPRQLGLPPSLDDEFAARLRGPA